MLSIVFLSRLTSHNKQPQGRDPLAGERTSAESGHPPTGRGISRIPRVKGERYSKSGMAGALLARFTVGCLILLGSEKVIRKEINEKERYLALASAIAATTDQVTSREKRAQVFINASNYCFERL